MPYTEYAKDEDGNQTPMATQTSPAPPKAYETEVVVERSNDRLQLFIKPKGCSIGKVLLFVFFYFVFLPALCSISLFLTEMEGSGWYAGVGLSIISWLLLISRMYKYTTTAYAITVQGRQINFQEIRHGKTELEETWSCSEIEFVEVKRRRLVKTSPHRLKRKTIRSGLLLSFPGAQNFLDRYLSLFETHGFSDELLDWMAREIAQHADTTVIVPSFGSHSECCP